MKKAFISVAFAAALFFGVSAQTVPSWYSYQGVATNFKNQEVKVVFYIVEPANADTPLYVEVHNGVKTNAAGAFSCQLGLGEQDAQYTSVYDNIEKIDWAAGPYQVVTYVNDVRSQADLGAVPYATIAGKAYGVVGVDNLADEIEALWAKNEDQDEFTTTLINRVETNTEAIKTLNEYAEGFAEQIEGAYALGTQATSIAMANEEAIAELKDQMIYATEQVDNALEGLTGLNNQVNDLASEVEKNADDIAATSEVLPELIQQVNYNKTGLALLEAKVNGLEAGEGVDLTEVNARIDAIETEVNTNIDAIDGLEQAVYVDLPGSTMEIRTDIGKLQEDVTKLQDDVTTNITAIDGLEQAVYVDLPESTMEIRTDIGKLQEDVNALKDQMEGIYEAFETQAMAAITSLSKRADDTDAAIEQLGKDLMEQIETQALGFTQLSNVVTDLATEVETNSNGLAEAEQTLIELTEQVRSNSAGVTNIENRYDTLYDHIMELKALIQTQGEAIADLQQQVLHIAK